MMLTPLDDALAQMLEHRLGQLLRTQRLGTLAPDGRAEITRTMRALSGRTGPAKLVLMAGLPGAGKTTLARELEQRGFLRLCPDERVWREHGHYGRDFPRGQYKVRERPIMAEVAVELRTALAAGRDVVLDHGFWTVVERQEWSRLGQDAGAAVTLVHLPGEVDALWERIKERNEATFDDPNAMFFTRDDLQRHANRFTPPGLDEPHVVYDGHPGSVLTELGWGDR
ncbi:ATP-binding protein [Streptomyces sp. NPDC002785]|uniref:AAA family ATPase n=1 Tax=Streptomyces sp. NPDC002785 TaxID=3154543 RepID=UPI00332E8824